MHTHEYKQTHACRGRWSLTPDTADIKGDVIRIICLSGRITISVYVFQALRTGHCPRAGCEAPSQAFSSTVQTVIDTITAVYCLCLTRSVEEMACKILLVWKEAEGAAQIGAEDEFNPATVEDFSDVYMAARKSFVDWKHFPLGLKQNVLFSVSVNWLS